MKRFIIIIACTMLAMLNAGAQSLEQRKICALKWTLQQAYYNKQEGQQIAHIDVTEFKTLADFQKNKLVSDAMKKLQDTSDQNRVKRIAAATTEADVSGAVPSGAKKEFQADVDKMKAVAPAIEPEPETEEPEEEPVAAEPEPEPEPQANVEPVEPETNSDIVTATDNVTAPAEGMSFVGVALTCLAIYIILTLCVYFFVRSRMKATQKQEEMVSMEQYRSERQRLIEKIKALEIDLEGVKSMKPKVAEEPAKSGHKAEAKAKHEHEQKPQPQPAIAVAEQETAKEEKVETVNEPATTEPEVQVQPATVVPTAVPTAKVEHTLFEQEPAPAVKEETAEPKQATETATTATTEDDKSADDTTAAKPAEPEIVVPQRMKSSLVMFYAVPTEGVFTEGTTEIIPGRSFYMLKTMDGVNGTFQILNTSENITEALNALSDIVKPACKILNTVSSPVEILAERPGQVVREADGWHITAKAHVRLI